MDRVGGFEPTTAATLIKGNFIFLSKLATAME